MLEIKYLENENKNILQQVEDLKTTISKFTNGKRTLVLLFGNQKLVDDKNGIQFTEDTNLSFQKSDSLESIFAIDSDSHSKLNVIFITVGNVIT